MNVKNTAFLAVVVILTIILLPGYQPVLAAPPTGEVKTVVSMLGNQIPIPYLEVAIANDSMQLLYDHLVGCSAEGKISPELGLSSKWEMSPDGLTWTFYLRKGVKFHDEVEVTAKDVKFSIELVRQPDSVMGDAMLKRVIKTIEVKDPYTVVIHCSGPTIFLPNFLSNMNALDGMVVPKDYYEKLGRDGFAKRPIGSGPYKFHSQMFGSFIKLEATDKHWRIGVPKYKYMTYLIIPEESTRMAMLKTGEADIARISRGTVKEAQSAGLNIVTKESEAVVYLMPTMQWAVPAFGDIRFRKALNLAIDREAIIKHIFFGMAKNVAMWPGSSSSVFGGDPTLKPYPYAPQEAAQLIKEGGWEGYEFNIPSYLRAGYPEELQVKEAIVGYWEKIGLKPKIVMTDFAAFRRLMIERKTLNYVHGGEDATSPDVPMLLPKFMDRWYFKNPRARVNIPELNERFERIGKSLDPAEVSRLMAEVYKYAYDQYSKVPICEIPGKIATTKRIPAWDLGHRHQDRNYYDLIQQR